VIGAECVGRDGTGAPVRSPRFETLFQTY
jgi:hypothetical protein